MNRSCQFFTEIHQVYACHHILQLEAEKSAPQTSCLDISTQGYIIHLTEVKVTQKQNRKSHPFSHVYFTITLSPINL